MTCLGKKGHVAIAVLAVLAALPGPHPPRRRAPPTAPASRGASPTRAARALPGVAVSIASPALQAPQLEAVTDDSRPLSLHHAARRRVHRHLLAHRLPDRVRAEDEPRRRLRRHRRRPHGARPVEETLTVVGESPLVDVRTTTEATNIKKELMETIPTSRAYADVGKLAPGRSRLRAARRRRQPDRRPARQPGELRIERRRPDADARRRQHRRHRRLLRLRRDRGDDRAARRQRRRDSHLRHGVPDHHQVRRQHLPRRRPRRLAGTAAAGRQHRRRAAQQGRHRRQPDGALLRRQRLARRPHRPRPAVVLRQRPAQGVPDAGPRLFAARPGADGVYFTADDEQGTQTDRESNVVIKLSGAAGAQASPVVDGSVRREGDRRPRRQRVPAARSGRRTTRCRFTPTKATGPTRRAIARCCSRRSGAAGTSREACRTPICRPPSTP